METEGNMCYGNFREVVVAVGMMRCCREDEMLYGRCGSCREDEMLYGR
jgi:hypothetical protein